jgi:hypothetical protein
MSIIVKSLQRFDGYNPPDWQSFFQDGPGRLGICLAKFAARPASCIGSRASRLCDSVLQGTFARTYSASKIAGLFVIVLTIFVATTLCRPVAPIEAGIGPGDVVAESRKNRTGITVRKALDQDRSATIAVAAAANTATRDLQTSGRDLALPLSRHVLKFVPPPANRNRTTAQAPQPSPPNRAKPPVPYNQPANTLPYTAKASKPQPAADNNLIQTAPAVHDPLVRLAATACFDGRERCTAVINGATVRVGQTISGYTLVQIRAGEVLMQKNNDYWSLKMDRGN